MEYNLRPSLSSRWKCELKIPKKNHRVLNEAERTANEARDEKIVNETWRMVRLGLVIFVGGFFIWILGDFCSRVKLSQRPRLTFVSIQIRNIAHLYEDGEEVSACRGELSSKGTDGGI